jgi:hypothetical protein
VKYGIVFELTFAALYLVAYYTRNKNATQEEDFLTAVTKEAPDLIPCLKVSFWLHIATLFNYIIFGRKRGNSTYSCYNFIFLVLGISLGFLIRKEYLKNYEFLGNYPQA